MRQEIPSLLRDLWPRQKCLEMTNYCRRLLSRLILIEGSLIENNSHCIQREHFSREISFNSIGCFARFRDQIVRY